MAKLFIPAFTDVAGLGHGKARLSVGGFLQKAIDNFGLILGSSFTIDKFSRSQNANSIYSFI
jgi:hypothetical protein